MKTSGDGDNSFFEPEKTSYEFTINCSPVSLQATSERKNFFKEEVAKAVCNTDFLIASDVWITIEWYIHEVKRYHEDRSADVDNIIKPILDGISGKTGIIIDDNQVQSVMCSWIDTADYENESVFLRIETHFPSIYSRKHLYFLHVGDNICFPISIDNDNKAEILFVENYIQLYDRYLCLLNSTDNYFLARNVLPSARRFHKSRLQGFTIINAQNRLDELKQSQN